MRKVLILVVLVFGLGGVITAAGTVAADTTYLQRRVSSTCGMGCSIRAIAADGTVTCQTDNAGLANAFAQGGNAFSAPAVLGTTQGLQLQQIVNDDITLRVIRTIADSANNYDTATPSLSGGWASNAVRSGVLGGVIGGGDGTSTANQSMPNRVFSHYGIIAGGMGNTAGNSAGANTATPFATVGGGYNNDATGTLSTIAGGGNNATGGVKLVTGIDGSGNTTWQCTTMSGSDWSCSSDRNLKQDLAPLDGVAVLEKFAAMQVYAWSPKGVNSHVRHYGPMAQDFMAAFNPGEDDKLIGMQDADGVALAATPGKLALGQ